MLRRLLRLQPIAVVAPSGAPLHIRHGVRHSHDGTKTTTTAASSSSTTISDRQRELMARSLPKRAPLVGVQHIVVVASGKGGVGKSTTACKANFTTAHLNTKRLFSRLFSSNLVSFFLLVIKTAKKVRFCQILPLYWILSNRLRFRQSGCRAGRPRSTRRPAGRRHLRALGAADDERARGAAGERCQPDDTAGQLQRQVVR